MSQSGRQFVLLGIAVALVAFGAGCTGNNSMSSYARTGDTVLVAFGSVNDVPYYRTEDLKAELTDSASNMKAVKIRFVANVYPDPTSRLAAEGSGASTIGLRSAVIDLVDPSTGTPPALSTGPAKLALRRVSDNVMVTSAQINIEILAGTGTVHPFTEQFAGLNLTAAAIARPQVRFKVARVGSYTQTLSGLEVELRYPAWAVSGRPENTWPQAVQTRPDANVQFATRTYAEGSNKVIKVVLTNPDGIYYTAFGVGPTSTELYRGASVYDTMRFSVAWGDTSLQASYPPETFDASLFTSPDAVLRVFDTNGADVSTNFSLVQE